MRARSERAPCATTVLDGRAGIPVRLATRLSHRVTTACGGNGSRALGKV